MQLRDQKINTNNPTLNQLIIELGEECQNVIILVNQFQLGELSNKQKVEILSELLASTIHLYTHCNEDLQEMISEELESLPDEDLQYSTESRQNSFLINIAEYKKKETLNIEDIKIWQYMKLDKLYSLLEEEKLYLSAVKNFDDPFEGTYTKANIDYLNQKYPQDQWREQNSQFIYEKLIKSVFVSCWHMNDYESYAMWKIYTENGKGIAIQSTLKRLLDSLNPSLSQNVYVGKINYIDFERDSIPIPENSDDFYEQVKTPNPITKETWIQPFLYKRHSFNFEKEIRVICEQIPDDFLFNGQLPNTPGIKISIKLDTLIDNIFVSPNYNEREKKIVQTIVDNFQSSIKRDIKIQQSNLSERPRH